MNGKQHREHSHISSSSLSPSRTHSPVTPDLLRFPKELGVWIFHTKLKHCRFQTLRERNSYSISFLHKNTVMENWTHQESTCSANWFAAPDLQQIKLHVLMSRVGQGILGPLWWGRGGEQVGGMDWKCPVRDPLRSPSHAFIHLIDT